MLSYAHRNKRFEKEQKRMDEIGCTKYNFTYQKIKIPPLFRRFTF